MLLLHWFNLRHDENNYVSVVNVLFQKSLILSDSHSLSMITPPELHPSSSQATIRSTKIFVLFVCAALIFMTYWLATQGRQEAVLNVTNANSNLNSAIAQQMDGMFSETTRILETISFELERANINTTALERLQPVLVNHVAGTEHIYSVMVLDQHGIQIVSSEVLLLPFPTDKEREYFIFHQNSLSLLRHIGTPYLSGLSNLWLIPVSRRLNDPSGKFTGVVVATIKVDYVLQIFLNYNIGRHGILALILDDGTNLARLPYAVTEMETNIAGSPLFKQIEENFSGHGEDFSFLDGIDRYLNFQHLKNNPISVIVARSKEEVLLHWRSVTIYQSAWILILSIFIAILGGRVIRLANGRLRVEHRLHIVRDELTEANRQLTHLARHDGLTGLANRRYFDEHLAREFAQCARTRRPLGLIMIDVDHFKLYNDTYGHPEGDKCLQAVAEAIRRALRRPHDFVARYGGEEFAVLLSETDTAGAGEVAEAIRAAVAMLDLPFAASPIGHVSISAGLASHMSPEPKANALSLLNDADKALYQAKNNGRNIVFSIQ